MLVATWNVNSLKARMARVEEWLATVGPDVVLLQETKLSDAQFPAMAFEALGYDAAHHGFGQWNGVAVLSRVGLDHVVAGFDDDRDPDPDSRILWATCGGVRVASVYVPNGRQLGHDHYHYKLDWLARLRTNLDLHHSPDELLVVGGDWNIAPGDIDVWNPAAFADSTHVSPAERAALGEVKAWGLVDTFRERYPDGGLYSYWDYRGGDFHQRRGMRIDYLLASRALADRCRSDLVDRNARKGTKPSDHAPVLAWYALEPPNTSTGAGQGVRGPEARTTQEVTDGE
ncbi:MAG: exodeoxyribonuclease III [Microthrixaceae bacterium]